MWWWILVALILGGSCGAFVMAVLAAGARGDERAEEIRERIEMENRRNGETGTKAKQGVAI